ncbi:MAG: hypothetical protein IIC51_03090 [Planctomycetes bacterium]|nr:hypothetical protein [Planctomycetota bacterium]
MTLGYAAPVFAEGATIRETEGNGFVVQVVRHAWVNETVREQRFLAERVAGELARE